MNQLFKNLTLIFILFMSFSCEEKNDPAVFEPENEMTSFSYPADEAEAITFLNNNDEKTWRATSFNLSSIGQQNCRLDDRITFKKDGTYSYTNGSLKCGGDVEESSGTYSFLYDGKQLVFDEGTDDEEVATIENLTSTDIAVKGSWTVFQISAQYEAE